MTLFKKTFVCLSLTIFPAAERQRQIRGLARVIKLIESDVDPDLVALLYAGKRPYNRSYTPEQIRRLTVLIIRALFFTRDGLLLISIAHLGLLLLIFGV